MTTKFTKNIKEIQDSNEFFGIDYEDLVQNFDRNNETEDEKVGVSMQLSLVNIAFLDSIRGPISRPKFLDRILTIYRREFIDDVKIRFLTGNDVEQEDDTNNKENVE